MNFKLITKHTNASFQNIHIVHAPVWCRRLFIMDKALFWALKNNINDIYRVYGRQCFHFRADITYSARVQVEHAKAVTATKKYPQPITHPANYPFRVRYLLASWKSNSSHLLRPPIICNYIHSFLWYVGFSSTPSLQQQFDYTTIEDGGGIITFHNPHACDYVFMFLF